MLNLLFPNQSMVVLPEETFTKSTETLKGSKAALVSRIPAHPKWAWGYGRQIWLHRLSALCQKGHCWYKDLCAFYHPGVSGTPLQYYAFSSGLERALCGLEIICVPVALGWPLWGSFTYYLSQWCWPSSATAPTWGPELCFQHHCTVCTLFSSSLWSLAFRIPSLLPSLQDPLPLFGVVSCASVHQAHSISVTVWEAILFPGTMDCHLFF